MADVSSVAEHSDLLVYIISFFAAAGIGETLRRLARIERKQDEQVLTHAECRKSLMSKADFKDWKEIDFKKWQEGRDGPGGLWHAINHHSHQGIDGEGKVIKG